MHSLESDSNCLVSNFVNVFRVSRFSIMIVHDNGTDTDFENSVFNILDWNFII